MNILAQIVAEKQKEIARCEKEMPLKKLMAEPFFARPCISLAQQIRETEGAAIIAEFKRQSPSKGIINNRVEPETVVAGYAQYGAAGISVLTDEPFFGGTANDLRKARALVNRPLLRKDFVLSEYQVAEAKSLGADVILLIAAILTPQEVRKLAAFATGLGLEVLLELHNEAELTHICAETGLVGVNNRNLKNFEVNLEHSIRLGEKIPHGKIKIAESGIHSPEALALLKQNGFHAFLMGEYFMKQEDPGLALQEFLTQVNKAAK